MTWLSSTPRRSALFALVVAFSAATCSEAPLVNTLDAVGLIAVDGAQLWYATEGSGAPVIVLHGGPGIGVGYIVRSFGTPGFPPEGFRWIVYDQRGSGQSTGAETPANLTIERFVEDLEAMRIATGQEQVALMGHSFGGLLAMHYAVAHPDRVAAMILLDPDPASRALWEGFREKVAARVTDEDRRLLEEIESSENWELDPVQLERHTLVRFRSYFGRREVADQLTLGLPRSVYGNFPLTAQVVREGLGDWDLFDALATVEARTLILTGDSTIFPMEAHERLAATLPRARLVVLPGVGHFPFMEDLEGFAREVGGFLLSIRTDSGTAGG